MSEINRLNNPFLVFIFFILISFVNIISSIYFAPIMFAGVVYLSFVNNLKNHYYYELFFMSVTFLVIEHTQGMKPFTLIALALLTYIFIKPQFKQIFASKEVLKYVMLIIFYLSIYVTNGVLNQFNDISFAIILINILIDITVVGLFL